jgi:hypothetical protein
MNGSGASFARHGDAQIVLKAIAGPMAIYALLPMRNLSKT